MNVPIQEVERKQESLSTVLTCLAVVAYLALALYRLDYPGVFYDELLWGNAARGGIDDTFIILKIYDIPVMLMSYIGALKAWLYYPVFKLFGVSAFTVRAPMVLLAALSIMLTKQVTARMFTPQIALATTILLALNTSFVTQTRVDQGPIVIALFLSLACLYYLLKLLDNFRLSYLAALFACCTLGVFNKLNFIWFVNALFCAALLAYWQQFQRQIRASFPRHFRTVYAVALGGYLLLVAAILVLNRLFGLTGEGISIPDRVSLVFNTLLVPMLRGDAFFIYALGEPHNPVSTLHCLVVAAILAIGTVILVLRRKELEPRFVRSVTFVALLVALLLLQVIITAKASAYWHIFVLFPFVTVLLGCSICVSCRLLFKGGAAARTAMIVVTVLLIAGELQMQTRYLRFYGQPERTPVWSSAMYSLIAYTRQSPQRFVSVDFGIHNQLLTFTGQGGKYFEACYWLEYFQPFDSKYPQLRRLLASSLFQAINATNSRPVESYALLTAQGFTEKKRWLTAEVLNPGNGYALILHPEGVTIFREARKNLFAQARQSGVKLVLEQTLADGNGRVIFEIYRPT